MKLQFRYDTGCWDAGYRMVGELSHKDEVKQVEPLITLVVFGLSQNALLKNLITMGFSKQAHTSGVISIETQASC